MIENVFLTTIVDRVLSQMVRLSTTNLACIDRWFLLCSILVATLLPTMLVVLVRKSET